GQGSTATRRVCVMVSVDVRSRTAADVRPVDAEDFFGRELPALVAERSHLALAGARELRPRPISFEIDGRAWTVALDDDGFSISAGGHGAAVVRLDAIGLTDLVNDLRTAMGFFVGGDLDMPA